MDSLLSKWREIIAALPALGAVYWWLHGRQSDEARISWPARLYRSIRHQVDLNIENQRLLDDLDRLNREVLKLSQTVDRLLDSQEAGSGLGLTGISLAEMQLLRQRLPHSSPSVRYGRRSTDSADMNPS